MAVEIGDLTLDHLNSIVVDEQARFVWHDVPGLDGDLVQAMGRRSVRLSLQGICYGTDAADQLNRLRQVYLQRQPVDLLADVVDQAYVGQVVIEQLQVRQGARLVDEFEVTAVLVEYVEPPTPPPVDLLGGIDGGLAQEAAGLVDAAQDSLAAVGDLAALTASIPSFGDPTSKLPEMPKAFDEAGSGALDLLTSLSDLL